MSTALSAAYLAVTRHGRRTALRREHRQAVWELYEEEDGKRTARLRHRLPGW